MSLKKRVIKASGVVISGFATAQLIRLAGNLVTTRILAPDLFGVMLLATALLTGVAMVMDAGVTSNLMRHESGGDKSFLKTTFSIKVIQGVFIALLLCAVSFGIHILGDVGFFPNDSVYASTDLVVALVILAATALLRSFTSIEVDLSRRKLLYGKVVIIEIASQTISVLFIIAYGVVDPTIYALAFAAVVSTLFSVFASYIFLPRENIGFGWDKYFVKDSYQYGKWIAGSSVIGMLSQHGDKLIFGYFLSSNELGQYAIASLITMAITGVLQKTNNIWLPVFGEISRGDPGRLSEIYYRIRFYRDLLVASVAGVTILCGDLIIDVLYDDRYKEAGWMLQFLGASFLIQAFRSIKEQIVLAHGESRLVFNVTLVTAVSSVALMIIFYKFFGIEGAVLAYSLKYLFGTTVIYRSFSRLGYLDVRKEIRTIPIMISGLILGYILRLLVEQILARY